MLLAFVLAISPWGHTVAASGEPMADEPSLGTSEADPGPDTDPGEDEDGSSLRSMLPDEERLAEAGAAFSRGVRAYKEGRFETALEEFSQAQRLAPHPDTLFNLGLAQQGVEDHVAAWQSFERLLGDTTNEQEREDIIAMQAISRPHVAWLRVETETPGLICFDGTRMATDAQGVPGVVTTPGQHRLDVDRAHRPLDLRGGEHRTFELELPPTVAPPMHRRRLRVLASLGIVGTGAAAGLGLGAALVDSQPLRLGLGVGSAASGTLALTTSVIALLIHRRNRRWTPPPPLRQCPP